MSSFFAVWERSDFLIVGLDDAAQYIMAELEAIPGIEISGVIALRYIYKQIAGAGQGTQSLHTLGGQGIAQTGSLVFGQDIEVIESADPYRSFQPVGIETGTASGNAFAPRRLSSVTSSAAAKR